MWQAGGTSEYKRSATAISCGNCTRSSRSRCNRCADAPDAAILFSDIVVPLAASDCRCGSSKVAGRVDEPIRAPT
jgi:hypothetical protein